MFAYSAVDATDIYPLTSAQAESVYGYTQRYDGENMVDTPSSYMIDDKFLFSLDYTTQIIGNNDTRFSLVYVAKSGERYLSPDLATYTKENLVSLFPMI